jgi:hypothetical protein
VLASDFRVTTDIIPTVTITRTDIIVRTIGITDIGIIVIITPITIGASLTRIAKPGWLKFELA